MIDSGSKFKAITSAYALKLGFVKQKTDIGIQKIDSFALTTYEMIITGFSLQHKLSKVWFFEEIFLLADTNMKVVLELSFFSLLDANIRFVERDIPWRRYTIIKALY